MADKKDNEPKKSKEEVEFEREFNKLKLSAERGIPYSDKKNQEVTNSETDADFLTRMKAVEDAMRNPDKTKIDELPGFPKFPKGDDLTDDEVKAALELATAALSSNNIELTVVYPTPDREIYRFITEELIKQGSGAAGVGGMTMHVIYEDHYPNYAEDMKSDANDILHYICRGYKGTLPWRISKEVSLWGEKISEAAFKAALSDHREVFQGMSYINVDAMEVNIQEPTAHVKAQFRFYLDESSGTPGQVNAEAEFYFEFQFDDYVLTRLVIDVFGIE